jgi:hypothetical protein
MRGVLMSIVFTWRKRSNTGLALILLGLTGLVQSYLVLNAQTSLGLTSIYILVLVPLGTALALSGVELSLAEAIFKRFSLRERRPTKWKTPQRTGLRGFFRRLEVDAAFSMLLILAISFVSYFGAIALLAGTTVPPFVRFVSAESLSMILALVLGIIAARMI